MTADDLPSLCDEAADLLNRLSVAHGAALDDDAPQRAARIEAEVALSLSALRRAARLYAGETAPAIHRA